MIRGKDTWKDSNRVAQRAKFRHTEQEDSSIMEPEKVLQQKYEKLKVRFGRRCFASSLDHRVALLRSCVFPLHALTRGRRTVSPTFFSSPRKAVLHIYFHQSCRSLFLP